ncbi:MAG: SIMPL domain-containing protein [Bacillota bacterium]
MTELLTGKRFWVLVLVIGCLLCIYTFYGMTAFSQQSVNAQAAAAQEDSTVTVWGQGEVKASPDSAQVNIGVITQAKSAKDAQSQNNRISNGVIAAVKDQGIPKEDIQTREFCIWPQHDEKGRNITGYQVNHTLSIRVVGTDKVGPVIDTAVAAGANHIYGISFEREDRAGLKQEALKKAVTDARERADALAKTAGKKVVRVVSIKEAGTDDSPPVYKRMAIEAGGAGAPVEPGQLTVTASVEVVFEIGG